MPPKRKRETELEPLHIYWDNVNGPIGLNDERDKRKPPRAVGSDERMSVRQIPYPREDQYERYSKLMDEEVRPELIRQKRRVLEKVFPNLPYPVVHSIAEQSVTSDEMDKIKSERSAYYSSFKIDPRTWQHFNHFPERRPI
jgi:hypothetical protein